MERESIIKHLSQKDLFVEITLRKRNSHGVIVSRGITYANIKSCKLLTGDHIYIYLQDGGIFMFPVDDFVKCGDDLKVQIENSSIVIKKINKEVVVHGTSTSV